MTARLSCCVPFCKRTTGKQFREWICAAHWRAVPREVKLFRRRADKANERARIICDGLTEGTADKEFVDAIMARIKASKRAARAWERCKRAAIERGMGIS